MPRPKREKSRALVLAEAMQQIQGSFVKLVADRRGWTYAIRSPRDPELRLSVEAMISGPDGADLMRSWMSREIDPSLFYVEVATGRHWNGMAVTITPILDVPRVRAKVVAEA